MSILRSFVVALLGGVMFASSVYAEDLGIAIGSKAPEFSHSDQAGKARTLEELLKNGSVALVFYRSADW